MLKARTPSFCAAMIAALSLFGAAAANAQWIDVSVGYNPEALARKLPPDALRSLDAPRFLPVAEAESLLPFMRDDDLLISVERMGERRLYPVKALIWHEIVNDRFGSEGVVVSYCILTGSPAVFLSEAVSPDGALTAHTFGVSGYLYESNLVMYDRQTGSTWPQLAFRCVSGSERGKSLSPLPYGIVSWGRAKRELRNVDVLCGDERSWMADPAVYAGRPSPALAGYETSSELRAPVSADAIAASGARAKSLVIYVPYSSVAALPFGSAELTQGGEPAVVMYEFAWRAFAAAGLLP